MWQRFNRVLAAVICSYPISCGGQGPALLALPEDGEGGAQAAGGSWSVPESTPAHRTAGQTQAVRTNEPFDTGTFVRVPTLTRFSQAALHKGETARVEGSDLSFEPQIIFGSMVIEPIEYSDVHVSFVVPEQFDLSGCERSVNVRVRARKVVSDPIPLTVLAWSPTIETWSEPVVAGEDVTFSGRGFQNATVLMDDVPLRIVENDDHNIVIRLPLDVESGTNGVSIDSDCGTALAMLQVLPPVPIIGDVRPLTVASGGIVQISVTNSNPGEILSAFVGNLEITANDRANFAWSNTQDSSEPGVLSVRVPERSLPGTIQIAVTNSSGLSRPVELRVVQASTEQPPASKDILFLPTATQVQTDWTYTYPVGTYDNAYPNADSYHWWYILAADDSSEYPYVCDGNGEIAGIEFYLNEETQSGREAYLLLGFSPARFSHPIVGTMQLGPSRNRVELTIDRTSSGGEVESYVGGWIATARQPAPSSSAIPADLVLVSQTNGRQLKIHHLMDSYCD